LVSSYFEYDKKKVIQALRYHFITRREIKIIIVVVNIFAIVSAVLFFAGRISSLPFLINSVFWFALMISFWFLLPNWVYRKAATFKDHFQVRFDHSHMVLSNERGEQSWPWTQFSSWMESPHFYHLYFDTRSFFLIPKEAFVGDDVHEARKMLKGKIGKG
jgi:hypothetical protein